MAMIDLSTLTDAQVQTIHDDHLALLTTGKGLQKTAWAIGETNSSSVRVATVQEVFGAAADELRRRFPGRYRARVTRMRCSFR